MSSRKSHCDIGVRLKHARKALDLTQSAFCAPLGVKQSYVSSIEKGEREPSETLIILMEYHYGINRKWLREGEGIMFLTRALIEQPNRSVKQVIDNSDGATMVGGKVSMGAGARIGGGYNTYLEAKDDPEVTEVCELVKQYASKSFLAKIKEKLLMIKGMSDI